MPLMPVKILPRRVCLTPSPRVTLFTIAPIRSTLFIYAQGYSMLAEVADVARCWTPDGPSPCDADRVLLNNLVVYLSPSPLLAPPPGQNKLHDSFKKWITHHVIPEVAEQRKLATSEAAVAADQAKHEATIARCKDRSAKALHSALAKLTSTPEKEAFAASVRAKYFVLGLSIAFSPFVVVVRGQWEPPLRLVRLRQGGPALRVGLGGAVRAVCQERLLEHIATAHFNGQKDLGKIGKRAAEPVLQPGQRQLQFDTPRVAPGIAPSASPAPTQSTAVRGAAPSSVFSTLPGLPPLPTSSGRPSSPRAPATSV